MATPIPANEAPLTAWSAAAATGGTVARAEGEGARARGITSDSRAVTPGSAFVALRGPSHDGHAFVAAAVERGASLVVVERGRVVVPAGCDVVEVDDTLAAWGALGAAHVRAWRRSRASSAAAPARVVAITGSAGKTTTKELAAALLASVGSTLATPGNLNNRIGVPAVAFLLAPSHRFAVVEMGMSLPGEIAALAAIAVPDVAVVVNAGLAHAEGVGGTRADVAREKGAIYAALPDAGVAIANADDAAAHGQLARTRAARVVTFGRDPAADYRLVARASLAARGSHVVIERRGETFDVDLPRVGEAAAIDLLAALACADAAAGAPLAPDAVHAALAALPKPSGRAAVRHLADGTVVLDDTYNANPESVRAALRTLAELAHESGTRRRAVAILGEMKELGAAAVDAHAAIGDTLAELAIDLAIGCGGLVDHALERAASRGVAVVKAPTVAAAAEEARLRVAAGDVVLVKGSRSVQTEGVVSILTQARGVADAREANQR